MVFSDIFRGLAVLGFLLVKDAEDIWILFVIGFIQASIGTFFAPARSALIPNIVGKDKLLAANSISETSRIIFGLIGTGLAGWIIGSSENFSLIFLIDAATFFLSMILITQIAYKHSYATDDDKITAQLIFSQLREGLKTTFGNPVLRGVIMAFATVMLGLGAVNILLVPLLVNDLQVPETWFAALEFSQTASMILAGSLVAVLAARFKPTKILGTSLIGLGIGVAAISLVGNVYHVMIVLFLVGWFIAPVQAAGSTILQTTVPDEVRGRTGSANNAIIQTANLISMGLAGYLADAIGTRNVFIIGGALVCIAGLIAFAIFRGVKMPDPEGIQAQTSNI